jgi:prephenate dehydrogenase
VVHGKKTDPKILHQVVYFWKTLCREVHVVDGKTHDRIVAQISHLPHVVSSLLVHSTDSKMFPFAGPGFRDTTRISQGDPALWKEIIHQNRENIERELKTFKTNIDKFLKHLEEDKNEHILKLLSKAAQKRKKLNHGTS